MLTEVAPLLVETAGGRQGDEGRFFSFLKSQRSQHLIFHAMLRYLHLGQK